MDVSEKGGLFDGYDLKLNSYDLGVDIELADAIQRLRFEHPEVKAVVLRSGKDNVFCAGANIRMLGSASHAHKVNFCKFTNETRNTIRSGGRESGQFYICAIKGACAGGGYELALACDYIIARRRRIVVTSRCPKCHCLPCCPERAALRALPTRERCAAISPTCSARSRKA